MLTRIVVDDDVIQIVYSLTAPVMNHPLRFTVCTYNLWTWTRWPERRDAVEHFARSQRPGFVFAVATMPLKLSSSQQLTSPGPVTPNCWFLKRMRAYLRRVGLFRNSMPCRPARLARPTRGVHITFSDEGLWRRFARGSKVAGVSDAAFPSVLNSIEELRELYLQPSQLVKGKKRPTLDEASVRFVRSTPLVFVGTSNGTGALEVSPRGGPVGWVKVLDERRILLPDLNGNNLLDSLTNILANPYVGLLFVHPGKDETLRINGRASITNDPELLQMCVESTVDGRTPRLPKVAVGVEVTDVFIHCAKAFRRGEVWQPESWPTLDSVDAIDLIKCQLSLDIPKEDLTSAFEKGYAADLKADFE